MGCGISCRFPLLESTLVLLVLLGDLRAAVKNRRGPPFAESSRKGDAAALLVLLTRTNASLRSRSLNISTTTAKRRFLIVGCGLCNGMQGCRQLTFCKSTELFFLSGRSHPINFSAANKHNKSRKACKH